MKPPLSPEQRTQVLEELEAILSSEAFSSSKRGQQFLRYIVEESLAGRGHLLKERSIGVELFSRPPSYDTGNDSVVRVAAGDVRQRLKHYQEHGGTPRSVLIDLPAGSYAPEFTFPAQVAPHRLTIGLPILLRLVLLAGLAVLLIGTAYFVMRSKTTALDGFWMPLKSSSSSVLVCVGHPSAYYFPHAEDRLGPNRKPGEVVSLEEISPIVTVMPNDAEAAVELSSFLGAKGMMTRMRSSTSTSFADLRNYPALMIGAFSNQWTMQRTEQLHFAFAHPVGQHWGIREQTGPWRHWEATPEIGTTTSRDYGLVSRVFDRETGQAFVAIGGILSPGTMASAECVMSAPCLDMALRSAPRDWERKNLQIVITAKVVSDSPGAPEVVAAYFW